MTDTLQFNYSSLEYFCFSGTSYLNSPGSQLKPRVNITGTPNKTKLMQRKKKKKWISPPKKAYNIVIQTHKHTHIQKPQCSQTRFPYLQILNILTG